MSEANRQSNVSELPDGGAEQAPQEDARRPYEPPRFVKKRSVARATLFTAMGPAMLGLTMMG